MDIKIKKENGVVFTPKWVVDFMVDEILNSQKITGKEKILDAGCGDGVFSVVATQKFSNLTGKSINKVIEENIYFTDISKEYVEKTKQNLQNLSENKIMKFNAILDDFCFHNFDEKFDYIIGNPPYVRIQNLNRRKDQLQKNFITASNGSIDLYFCFFEQALKLLKEEGKISFITPNSHFYSAAGKNLRNLILLHLTKIINFDHFQIFKDAIAYTAITFLQKEKVDVGTIAVDAIFTPIRRVAYEVEDMRVGDRTNHNRLRISIETDGTLTAREVLSQSIAIMINQLKAIIDFKDEEQEEVKVEKKAAKAEEKVEDEDDKKGDDFTDALKTRTDGLDLSTRTLNALTSANIRTLGGLARKKREDLLEVEGIGEKGITEIKKVLGKFGLNLKE